jgi:anti-sigma B factor antagonist
MPDGPGTPLSSVCSIEVERHMQTSIVRLHGEFDLGAETRFEEEIASLLDDATATVMVDLRGLTFMDSTGLRALVSLYKRADHGSFDFAILCEDGNVRRVLRETGLDGVLPVIDPAGAVPVSDSPL